MAKSEDDTQGGFRSFTVRVPMDTYLQLCELAQGENVYLNKKVNQLLQIGMGKHVKLDDMLLRLIKGASNE